MRANRGGGPIRPPRYYSSVHCRRTASRLRAANLRIDALGGRDWLMAALGGGSVWPHAPGEPGAATVRPRHKMPGLVPAAVTSGRRLGSMAPTCCRSIVRATTRYYQALTAGAARGRQDRIWHHCVRADRFRTWTEADARSKLDRRRKLPNWSWVPDHHPIFRPHFKQGGTR